MNFLKRGDFNMAGNVALDDGMKKRWSNKDGGIAAKGHANNGFARAESLKIIYDKNNVTTAAIENNEDNKEALYETPDALKNCADMELQIEKTDSITLGYSRVNKKIADDNTDDIAEIAVPNCSKKKPEEEEDIVFENVSNQINGVVKNTPFAHRTPEGVTPFAHSTPGEIASCYSAISRRKRKHRLFSMNWTFVLLGIFLWTIVHYTVELINNNSSQTRIWVGFAGVVIVVHIVQVYFERHIMSARQFAMNVIFNALALLVVHEQPVAGAVHSEYSFTWNAIRVAVLCLLTIVVALVWISERR